MWRPATRSGVVRHRRRASYLNVQLDLLVILFILLHLLR